MSRRKTTLARVDRDTLDRMKKVMPNMTNSQRFRITFNTSLVRFENTLRELDRAMMSRRNGKKKL